MKAYAEREVQLRLILHFDTGWKRVFSLRFEHFAYGLGETSRDMMVDTGSYTIQFWTKLCGSVSHSLSPARKTAKQSTELQAAAPRLYWRGRCISEREMAAARSDPLGTGGAELADNTLFPVRGTSSFVVLPQNLPNRQQQVYEDRWAANVLKFNKSV
jgi:hypothetical protein